MEATVSDPKDINPFSESDATAPKDTPPLTVMSLSVKTIVNHAANKREVVCVSARTWVDSKRFGVPVACRCLHSLAHIDDPKPPAELPCTVYTYVRPLVKFPAGFEAKTRENKTRIMPMKNERMLLNQLLGNVCSLAAGLL